ncbi:MAG: response regulator [Draconibacterium sp.]|nr:response regulator [Draconibacterium sp.]
MKILLIEDNLLNQKVVMYFLRKYKYDITTVIDGNDAVEVIINNNFDLILMDIMLPGMNGFEITYEIRKFEKENKISKPVVIIALTAATYNNDRDKCILAGMDDYLSKPFTAEQLNNKIKKFF